MIFGPSVDEKHETLIAKVGVVVSRFLLFMLFRFFASPFLSVSTLARSRPHLRRPWSVIFLLRQAWVRVPELLPLFSSSCSLSTPLPLFFFVSGYFLVWCFEGFAYAASGVKAFPTLNCVMCASSVLSVFRSVLRWWYSECAELGVCFFCFWFFFGLRWGVLWLASVLLCGVMFWGICARVCSYVFLSLPPSFLSKRKIWYWKCGELC